MTCLRRPRPCLAAAFMAVAASGAAGCATTTDRGPSRVDTYPVPYDALADCVIASHDWPGNAFSFTPLASLGETRISIYVAFEGTNMVWRFRRDGAATAAVEYHGTGPALYDELHPVIDQCAEALAAQTSS